MNLDNIFKRDSAIVDHSWMDRESIIDVESMKKPNNIKPELEMEWNLGGPDVDLNEPAGIVQRNLPDDAGEDASKVIIFARDMMNRGFSGRKVAASLKNRFSIASLTAAKDDLRSLFALDGIIGRIVVDSRGYKDCRAAIKTIANSPYKNFVKYVYGCNCGDPHVLPEVGGDLFGDIQDGEGTGNAMDDFFTGGRVASKAVVSHCRSTMLPIMSARGDLDKSMLDGTLVEMMNLNSVPAAVVSSIKSRKGNNLGKIREAFRWIDRQAEKAEDQKYAGKTYAGEFHLKQADNEVSFIDAPEAEMEIDGTNPSLMTEIEAPMPAPSTTFDGINSLNGILEEVDVMESESQLPVEMMDEENLAELGLEDVKQNPEDLVLDGRSGEIEIELFNQEEPEDIELEQFKEEEFKDTDIIDLEDMAEGPGDLDVNMKPDMDIEL
jgi:hypothetical protein